MCAKQVLYEQAKTCLDGCSQGEGLKNRKEKIRLCCDDYQMLSVCERANIYGNASVMMISSANALFIRL
jgi:hypothetical protein